MKVSVWWVSLRSYCFAHLVVLTNEGEMVWAVVRSSSVQTFRTETKLCCPDWGNSCFKHELLEFYFLINLQTLRTVISHQLSVVKRLSVVWVRSRKNTFPGSYNGSFWEEKWFRKWFVFVCVVRLMYMCRNNRQRCIQRHPKVRKSQRWQRKVERRRVLQSDLPTFV